MFELIAEETMTKEGPATESNWPFGTIMAFSIKHIIFSARKDDRCKVLGCVALAALHHKDQILPKEGSKYSSGQLSCQLF